MNPFVLDCSVAMAWCFEDESNAFTDKILDKTAAGGALVPAIWPLEVQNVLLVAERRGRLKRAQSARFLEILASLPIHIDPAQNGWAAAEVMSLARELTLSAYDAAYIALAMRHGAPLATLDKSLQKAAARVGVLSVR